MALSAARNTPIMNIHNDPINTGSPDVFPFKVAAGVKIWSGAQVVLSGGYAQPGTTATGLIAVGMATQTVDNTGGAAGALTVQVQRGTFEWVNSSGDPIAQVNVGSVCYVVDDQTVSLTNGSGTQSPAGVITRIDTLGVWVDSSDLFAAAVASAGNDGTPLPITSGGTGASTATAARTALAAAHSGVSPTFTGSAATQAVNYGTPLFSGTGMTASGSTMTSTDNQTMTLNQCAGCWLVCASHGPYLIASNTAVNGAPAVLTIYGTAPTTDAGTYKILAAPTPAGTISALT